MSSQTEAPIDTLETDLEEDIEWVSKSQLKRDSKALQDLGKKLSHYNDQQLDRIPMPEALKDAIELAQKISNKRSALKRHYQYIGKLLRNIDVEPIIQAVEKIEVTDQDQKRQFKLAESWRDKITELGDEAINACCQQHPQMDRQRLRQLFRNHRNANSPEKKTRLSRELFREVQAQLSLEE